jgi:hypothetical protein
MRVSVPENFQNSAMGGFLFLEKLFSAVGFSRSVSMSGFERLDRLSLSRRTRRRAWNGNYRHGAPTKATIELWRFIKTDVMVVKIKT